MEGSIWEPCRRSIPIDIALRIAYLLEAEDVCSLGSCSRFWRGICFSDWLWMELAKKRWPLLDLGSASSGSLMISRELHRFDQVEACQISPKSDTPFSPRQGWRKAYIYNHQSLASSVSAIKEFVEQCTQNESLEVGCYLKAINDLHSYQFGFKDVQIFLFSKSCNTILNLIGLHYCLLRLLIPQNEVMLALQRNKVSEREVCVRWYKLGRWFFGFRLHDERCSQKITLGMLAIGKGNLVLGVLNRGVIHEVIRVHIVPADGKDEASSLHTACEN